MTYTDDELTNPIACAKRVSVPPKREMRVLGQMFRNDAELESLDGNHTFRAYMRQSRQFAENFSIGLEYRPKDEPASFCLIRCNGRHGGARRTAYQSNRRVRGLSRRVALLPACDQRTGQ